VSRHGLQAVAQVDLGTRAHRHQANHDLALMAAELLLVADRRRPRPGEPATGQVAAETVAAAGSARPGEPPARIKQFVRSGGQVRAVVRSVPAHERPTAASVIRPPEPR